MLKTIEEKIQLLIVDDEMENRDVFQMIFEDEGYEADTACDGLHALQKLKKKRYDIVLTDLMMGEMDGIELLKEIKKTYPEIEVILITGYGTIQNAVEAMKEGAYSYFVKGNTPEDLIKDVASIKDKIIQNMKKSMKSTHEGIKTKSLDFQRVIEVAEKAARSNVNILILGESGVGKEYMANYIHSFSHRKDGEFVAVNCSAFSDTLLESELFGHEKGAFTGALDMRKGRFEIAHGGTLFLDEIGDVSLNTQVKLLRSIENKKIQRLGSNKDVECDFRLISATNKDLAEEIKNGNFREDFFYRLSTIVIEIPPLRERREDLEDLINHFVHVAKEEMNKESVVMEDGVMKELLNYNYPGNIRELKNIIYRLVVLSEDGVIKKSCMPELVSSSETKQSKIEIDGLSMKKKEEIKHLKDVRREIEAEYVSNVLELCQGNISESARMLGISRRQLFNKVREYDLR